jgi:hypothetical protein
MVKEHGVWVFRAGQALPASATDKMLQKTREERDLANLGQEGTIRPESSHRNNWLSAAHSSGK